MLPDAHSAFSAFMSFTSGFKRVSIAACAPFAKCVSVVSMFPRPMYHKIASEKKMKTIYILYEIK